MSEQGTPLGMAKAHSEVLAHYPEMLLAVGEGYYKEVTVNWFGLERPALQKGLHQITNMDLQFQAWRKQIL